jgi:hypothetical protein
VIVRNICPLTDRLVALDLETLTKVEVEPEEALRTLRLQAGRCAWCGFDLDRHKNGPCAEPVEGRG